MIVEISSSKLRVFYKATNKQKPLEREAFVLGVLVKIKIFL